MNQAIAVSSGGVKRFAGMSKQLPMLLQRLRTSSPMTTFPDAPGVYLFTEGATPLYVGQTRRLGRRMAQHRRPYSKHNQAVFAFNIAKGQAITKGIDVGRTRRALEEDALFAEMFRLARLRVAGMDVRFVEITDPELRTVFEVYAAVALGTQEFNSFDKH